MTQLSYFIFWEITNFEHFLSIFGCMTTSVATIGIAMSLVNFIKSIFLTRYTENE